MKVFLSFVLLFSLPAFGATVYVSKTGNDTTGDGSSGLPWLTIGKANTGRSAGDVIVVRAGRYLERITPTSGVTYSAEYNAVKDALTNTSMQGFSMSSGNKSNVTIRGFEITDIGAGNRAGVLIRGTMNTTIELCYFHAMEHSGVDPDGAIYQDTVSTNTVIRSNVLYRVEGPAMSINGYGCTIEANDVSRGVNFRVSDNFVYDSDVDCCRLFGINNTVTNNYFHDLWFSEQLGTNGMAPPVYPLGPHMDGLMMFSSGNGVLSSNNLIIANVFKNIDDQHFITSDFFGTNNLIKNVTFRNNIFWNNGGGGFGPSSYSINMYDTPNATFENNVWVIYGQDERGTNYSSASPIRARSYNGVSGGGQGCTNIVFRNNIIAGYGANNGPVFENGTTNSITMDYNLWETDWTNPGKYPGQDANTIVGVDPLFVSASSGNFRLSEGSPAKNSGQDLSAYFSVDKDGNTRTAPWDIGAYELIHPTGSVGSITTGTLTITP